VIRVILAPSGLMPVGIDESGLMPSLDPFSRWFGGGDKVMIVNRNAAQLFLPNEHRIPVSLNHLDMVKFAFKG
jgi:hypothetical protein